MNLVKWLQAATSTTKLTQSIRVAPSSLGAGYFLPISPILSNPDSWLAVSEGDGLPLDYNPKVQSTETVHLIMAIVLVFVMVAGGAMGVIRR